MILYRHPWPLLGKIISGLERTDPVPRGSREGEGKLVILVTTDLVLVK